MNPPTRSVSARWTGGLRAEVDAGGFTVVSDEPESVGGSGSGPQPTELLLASVASCFTIAVAYTAAKRGVDLDGLTVDVTGTYDGPRFRAFRIEVRADRPQGADLTQLVEVAKRVCYVTRTLAEPPDVEFVVT